MTAYNAVISISYGWRLPLDIYIDMITGCFNGRYQKKSP